MATGKKARSRRVTKASKRLKQALSKGKKFMDYILDTEISELYEKHGKDLKALLKFIALLILFSYMVNTNNSVYKLHEKFNNLEVLNKSK